MLFKTCQVVAAGFPAQSVQMSSNSAFICIYFNYKRILKTLHEITVENRFKNSNMEKLHKIRPSFLAKW